jgi:hypothetical protein
MRPRTRGQKESRKARLQMVLPRDVAKDVRRAAVESETPTSAFILEPLSRQL